MKMKTMKVHPVAKMFPTIGAKEMKELKADIEARGIVVPILVNKDKDTILDGRNRYNIAYELGLGDGNVPMEVFKGKDEEIPGEIIARNILRRHLTDDQRVQLVQQIRGPQIEKEAAERMKAGHPSLKSDEGRGRASERLAAEAKTTRHQAEQAIDVAKHAKDIVADVVGGKV